MIKNKYLKPFYVIAGCIAIVIGVRQIYQGIKGIHSSSDLPDRSSIRFLTFQDPETGIKILYPENWEQKTPENYLVSWLPPSTKGGVNLGLAAADLEASPPTIEELGAQIIEQTQMEMERLNQPFKLLLSEMIILSSGPAYKFVYTIQIKDVLVKGMQIITIHGRRAYFITYSAPEFAYENFLGTVQKMLASFEVVER